MCCTESTRGWERCPLATSSTLTTAASLSGASHRSRSRYNETLNCSLPCDCALVLHACIALYAWLYAYTRRFRTYDCIRSSDLATPQHIMVVSHLQDILRNLVVPCEENPLPVSELEIDEFQFHYTGTRLRHLACSSVNLLHHAAYTQHCLPRSTQRSTADICLRQPLSNV
jgi:hypothetical protein